MHFLAITQVWDLIETWDFRMDDPCDFPDIPITPHKKFTKPNITQLIKNCDFSQFFGRNSRLDDPCDFPDTPISPHKKITKPNIMQTFKNDDFSQFFGHNSSLGFDRDLGFARGCLLDF